jgi:hypothetical protein
MRERHNWAEGKHPKTCTCAACQQRRAEASMPRTKKKRKPKSMRGKKKLDASSALAEALDIFGFPAPGNSDEADPGSDGKHDE